MDGPDDDGALVERARGGDHGAYGELVARYQDVALRVAVTVAGRDADPEAAVQEAFVKAFRALPRFRAGEPFRPWLLTIVANEARNRRRSLRRRQRAVFRLGGMLEPVAADAPEADVLAADERRRLVEALDRLSERDRQVLACRYLLDLSERETAEALGVARGTVKSRQSRALDRLRAVLEGGAA